MKIFKRLFGLILICFNFQNIQVVLCCVPILQGKQGSSQKAASVEELNDVKELKKLLRTKNNVLICFISSMRQAASVVKIFRESADLIRGQGTMVIVDCSG